MKKDKTKVRIIILLIVIVVFYLFFANWDSVEKLIF